MLILIDSLIDLAISSDETDWLCEIDNEVLAILETDMLFASEILFDIDTD